VTQLAHFTLTELAGTLAIWACGIGLGIALATRWARGAVLAIAVMALLAVLSMLGDGYGWDGGVVAAIDIAFMLMAAATAVALWRSAARSAAPSAER
jgi:hypothetical protein